MIENKARKPDKITRKSLDIFVKDLGGFFKSIEIIKSIETFKGYTKSRTMIVKKYKVPVKFGIKILIISNHNNWALISLLFVFF